MATKVDYEKLTINPSPRWWFNTKVMFMIQRLMYKFPALGKPFRYIGYRLNFVGQLAEREKHRLKFVSLLRDERDGAQRDDSPYGYDDVTHELLTTMKYHRRLKQKDFETLVSEAPLLYKNALRIMTNVFERDKSVTDFVNFGVCYAHVDSVLAQKFPHIHFIGLDRSPFTKMYNEQYFSNMKNMEFVSGDIIDLIKNRKMKGACLFHMRTACFMPKSFLENLYKLAFDAGYKYVFIFEQAGISRETFKPYTYSENDQPSVLFRDGFFIHNYPGILSKAGFDIESAELVKTNHAHEDFRIMCVVGKRREK